MSAFSVDGSEDSWALLERVSRDDRPLVVRVRDNGELLAHAERTGLAVVGGRIRSDFLADRGMPSSGISEDLDAWEDDIIAAIQSQGVEAFALAVVNGDGRKDLVFATAGEQTLPVASKRWRRRPCST